MPTFNSKQPLSDAVTTQLATNKRSKVMSFKKKMLFPLVVAVSISACTTILSTNYDKEKGAESAKLIAVQMGLYEPEVMQQYVDDIGQRLVKELDNNTFDFQFSIVDDPIPNAFALPGGYIYVSRGLLALLVTEDELACVLAHEIIHVTERHSIQQMSSSILPTIIEIPGNIIGLFSYQIGNLINTPISAGNELLLSRYSRGHETEADTLGVALAAKAGYDPTSMSKILTRLNDAVELSMKQKQEKSYFDTHPYTPDRVKNVNKISTGLVTKPRDDIDPSFPKKLDGLVYGKNPANGVFQNNIFLHPTMNFTIDFPTQWALYNQPQAVIATREKEQAFIALTGVDNDDNALSNAKAFEKKIKKESGKDIRYKEIDFDWGAKGYFASFHEKGQIIQFLWIDLNKITFQISSMAPNTFEANLLKSIMSFKPITEAQKETIKEQTLHVVMANKNEKITDLSTRQKNVSDIKYVTLINDVELEEALEKDQAIKIITEQRFIDGLLAPSK